MIQKSFAKRVSQVVEAIPKGRVLTYKEVAQRAGNPKAFRAVGNILHRNHDPHIPCHRVIRSDGTAGGYNRGNAAKRKRLQQEGILFYNTKQRLVFLYLLRTFLLTKTSSMSFSPLSLFWKTFFIILFLSTSFASFTLVFAAGGGGGGGSKNTPPPSTCTQDTWECTNWSQCSLEGQQTRTCTLKNNCPTAETPKPTETQKCTPPRTNTAESKSTCSMDEFDCAPWSACQEGGFQTRECSMSFDCPNVISSLPPTRQRCEYTETCIEDTYECSDWSQCQEDGKQRRECKLTQDCAKAETVIPETEQVCPGLTCGQLSTLQERVACRLNLPDDKLAEEFQILYFPEYCKWEQRKEGTTEEDKQEQTECIQLYQSFGQCWALPFGQERRDCGRKASGIADLEADKDDCLFRTGEDRAACAAELQERVEHLSLFYLYELEIQAEELLVKDLLNFQDVVDWEVYIEEQKVKFDQAETLKEWKNIIIEVKDRWKAFTSKVIL